ncbi:peptide deformylase [Kroppenstedtia guangzhouensis]|uniref:Peptide deformylase n=1 Tax=Kroppenstedtia guangzhouensis TaxID=1274356 RepID=A0ABQ1G6Y4_9BACL|nr:peptide deformylase [Kroppenstedtia guangzhouensis]GGA37884.1 peptide deformylase [Kroppenstedtia guangzhouensis]
MAERNILLFGDPILRKRARPVHQITPKIEKLLDDLADTLYAKPGRAALAAPQVGMLWRVIVIDGAEGLIELINPEIQESHGEQVGPEACLSYPGYTGIVKRAKYVKVKTLNRHGETWFLEGENHLARCIQHEIDHLNGVLFIDHIRGNHLYHDQTKQPVHLLDALRLAGRKPQ